MSTINSSTDRWNMKNYFFYIAVLLLGDTYDVF